MTNNALYFPYVAVPDARWTIKTLLYWDKLSSIVPMEFIHEPEKMGFFMQRLVRAQLVDQIFPGEHIHKIEKFEDAFIKLVEIRASRDRKRSNSRTSIHADKLIQRKRIHVEKMGQIPDFLVEHRLATKIDDSWFEVDSIVADIFMAYLATCLGALDEVDAAPVTNQTRFANLFSNKKSFSRTNGPDYNTPRDLILNSLLPVPKEKVSFDQLLRFKSDHGHLLPPFRQKVEAHCSLVANIEDQEDKALLTDQFIADCNSDIEEISDAMKPTWRQISFGSLAPLFGAGLSLKALDVSMESAFVGGALTFTSCAYSAISSIRSNRVTQLKKPLAYVAHSRSGIFA